MGLNNMDSIEDVKSYSFHDILDIWELDEKDLHDYKEK
jgi:hypothetical protein